MKKVFLTLAVVFATSTVLVSCGGKKDASANTSATEEKKDTTTQQPQVEVQDTTKKEGADTLKKEADAKGADAKGTDAKGTDAKKDEKNPK
jgi:hypothetical protein